MNNTPSGAYADLDALLHTRFAGNQLNLQFAKPSKALLSGPVKTRFKGRGMEFEEVRLYQAGDDIRSIDWRVTARTQVPHTKLFQEEREKPVFLVLDQRSNMFFGSRHCFKSVYAAHLAATLGWAALAQNDRVGALIFGDHEQADLRPKRSKHAQMAFLQKVVEFNHQLKSPIAEKTRTPLAEILADILRVARPGSKIFIISDFFDLSDDCEKSIYQLSRHNDVVLLQVYDELEAQWPIAASLAVSNGQERLQIDASNRAFQNNYRLYFDQKKQALQTLANKLSVTVISASTGQNPERLLTGIYGKNKRSSKLKTAKST